MKAKKIIAALLIALSTQYIAAASAKDVINGERCDYHVGQSNLYVKKFLVEFKINGKTRLSKTYAELALNHAIDAEHYCTEFGAKEGKDMASAIAKRVDQLANMLSGGKR